MCILYQHALLQDEALAPLLGEKVNDGSDRAGHEDDAERGKEYVEDAQTLRKRGHVAVAHRTHRDHREVHAVDPVPVPEVDPPAFVRLVFVPASDRLVPPIMAFDVPEAQDAQDYEGEDVETRFEKLEDSGVHLRPL
jgi:hypothetical protein